MMGAIIAASVRTQFQPWYLLYVVPFAVLLSYKYYVVIPLVILSVAGTAHYMPYLYSGNWDPPVPVILDWLLYGSLVLSVAVVFLVRASRYRL
jgi:hypothetical protein